MSEPQQLFEAARHRGLHQGQPFDVRLELRPAGLCLVFDGPVPVALPSATMTAIQKAIQAHTNAHAYVDLHACSYLGSGAIACLMEYLRFVSPRGLGSVPVVNPHARAITVLRMLGLANFFVPVADDAAAATWFAQQRK
ncbi:MAG: hypothetical protein AAB263_03070 [Planctomycetota bacterium]